MRCKICGEREVFREGMCVICYKINKYGYGNAKEVSSKNIATGKPITTDQLYSDAKIKE